MLRLFVELLHYIQSYVPHNFWEVRLFTVPEALREYRWLNVAKASVMYWTYVRSPVSWPLVPTELLKLITKRKTSFRRSILHTGVSSGIDFTPGKTNQCGFKQNSLWLRLILCRVSLFMHSIHTWTHILARIPSYQKYFYWNENLKHNYFQEFIQFTFSKIFLPFQRKTCKIKLQWYCYH